MTKKVEHIGIAVKDLKKAQQTYGHLLEQPPYKVEEVAGEKVKTVFFKAGETKIELLEATSTDSAIAKFIEKKGEGIHHVAYEVDNIEREVERLQEKGFSLINEKPKPGADNKQVVFLHPKSVHGVLVELCQNRPAE